MYHVSKVIDNPNTLFIYIWFICWWSASIMFKDLLDMERLLAKQKLADMSNYKQKPNSLFTPPFLKICHKNQVILLSCVYFSAVIVGSKPLPILLSFLLPVFLPRLFISYTPPELMLETHGCKNIQRCNMKKLWYLGDNEQNSCISIALKLNPRE